MAFRDNVFDAFSSVMQSFKVAYVNFRQMAVTVSFSSAIFEMDFYGADLINNIAVWKQH